MTVSVNSAALAGIDAVLISVETRVCAGVSYFIVGLPGEAVKESLFRVESAITSCSFDMPRQKILVSLAPAGIRKEGAVFDLPIALSVLAASGQLAPELMNDFLFTGELPLTGKLRPVKGALSVAVEARKAGIKNLVVPKENANEAAVVSDLAVFGFDTLAEVVDFLHEPGSVKQATVKPIEVKKSELLYSADFSEVRGQEKVSGRWR